jgi:3-oxoacyl-[acyl-carrier protein] reductase
MGDLAGKAAFVTGGNIGIGGEVAVRLAKLGADVAFTWHSHSAGPVEEKITALGRRALALRVDVTRSVEVSEAVCRAGSELGPLHVLVANAGGLLERVALGDMTDEHWHAVLETNLSSAFYLVRAGLPHMADGGRVVLMSSLAASTGGAAGAGAYAAAKAGMLGLARALAKEVACRGISVNAICPGFIQGTPFHDTFTSPKDQDATIRRLPVGRGGSTGDVGALVGYLATESTGFLTGQAITISGGQELV